MKFFNLGGSCLTHFPYLRYLMCKGRKAESLAALERLRGKSVAVQEEYIAMTSSCEDAAEDKSTCLTLADLKPLAVCIGDFNWTHVIWSKQDALILRLFGWMVNRKKFVCTWCFLLFAGLMLFQQFSGINAVMFYSVSIFKDSGSTSPHLATIILGLCVQRSKISFN